jgi:hypothetical protein
MVDDLRLMPNADAQIPLKPVKVTFWRQSSPKHTPVAGNRLNTKSNNKLQLKLASLKIDKPCPLA